MYAQSKHWARHHATQPSIIRSCRHTAAAQVNMHIALPHRADDDEPRLVSILDDDVQIPRRCAPIQVDDSIERRDACIPLSHFKLMTSLALDRERNRSLFPAFALDARAGLERIGHGEIKVQCSYYPAFSMRALILASA